MLSATQTPIIIASVRASARVKNSRSAERVGPATSMSPGAPRRLVTSVRARGASAVRRVRATAARRPAGARRWRRRGEPVGETAEDESAEQRTRERRAIDQARPRPVQVPLRREDRLDETDEQDLHRHERPGGSRDEHRLAVEPREAAGSQQLLDVSACRDRRLSLDDGHSSPSSVQFSTERLKLMRQFSNPTHVSLAVVLQIRSGALRALLWQRAKEPFFGAWSLPGGYLERGETLEQAIRRDPAATGHVAPRDPLEPPAAPSR